MLFLFLQFLQHFTLFPSPLVRKILRFSPQIEIKYLKEAVESGVLSEINVLPKIEELQKKVKFRKVYKVRTGIFKSILGSGLTSTPGAIYAQVVSDIDEAKRLNKSGKGAIIVLDEDSRELFTQVFDLPHIGIITTYGDMSSHEAVLTRLAGIPSIINIEKDVIDRARRENNVLLDGNNNEISLVERDDVLEEDTAVTDASYGVDIVSLGKKIMTPYLEKDGKSVRNDITLQKLRELNSEAVKEYESFVARGDKEAAFKANIKKHFLHKLLILKELDEKDGTAQEPSPGSRSSSPISTEEQVGGIDLNEIKVDRQGSGTNIQFDSVQFQMIFENGVDGFVPIIINLTPINSILPILGLEPRKKDEGFELSQMS